MENLYCPHDDHELLIQKTGHIHLAYCPQCGGTWYYGTTLAKLFFLKQNKDFLAFGKNLYQETESRLFCPECHMYMTAKTFYEDNGLTINQCHQCYGVWLERGELVKTRTILRRKIESGELHTRPILGKPSESAVIRYAPFRGYPVAKTAGPLPSVIQQLPPVRVSSYSQATTNRQSNVQNFQAVSPQAVETTAQDTPSEYSQQALEEKRVSQQQRVLDLKQRVLDLPRLEETPKVQIDDDDPTRNERQEEIELEKGVKQSEVSVAIWVFTVLTGLPLEVYNPPRKRFPFVTIGLIALNFLIAFYMFIVLAALETDKQLIGFVEHYGATSDHIFAGTLFGILSHMFLHGNWLHLIGNMYFLWLFGDNVEDRLGHWKYLGFYLICGILSCMCQLFAMGLHSHIPLIGASGAIAGIMAAYVYLFPKSYLYQRILFIPWPFKIPVPVYFIFWLGFQFFCSLMIPDEGIAWWAHIGGFIVGFALIFIWYQMRPKWRNHLQKRPGI